MADELAAWSHRGLMRHRRPIRARQGVRVELAGRTLVNFGSNDYLDLASDARLAQASARAARRYGSGAGASPLVCGYLPPLRRLERELARWEGTEAALVFSSGFAANLAAVSALAVPDDAIFSDALNHASLIDGCRLSRAVTHIYRHADIGHLRQVLREHAHGARRRLIVTDTVFSMDGDLAPLADIVRLAEEYDALIVADEAHATGVLGETGRGVTELAGIASDRLIKVGTLSKALGAQGGFVCGTRQTIRWLLNRGRSYVFSTGLCPAAAGAARRAVRVVKEEPERRRTVLKLAQLLREQLASCGLANVTGGCHIVPLIVGAPDRACEISARLQEQGFLVPAIRPPSVPENTSRLRMSLTAGHTREDVLALVGNLRECMAGSNGQACQEVDPLSGRLSTES